LKRFGVEKTTRPMLSVWRPFPVLMTVFFFIKLISIVLKFSYSIQILIKKTKTFLAESVNLIDSDLKQEVTSICFSRSNTDPVYSPGEGPSFFIL
jgi:hypothetical protein